MATLPVDGTPLRVIVALPGVLRARDAGTLSVNVSGPLAGGGGGGGVVVPPLVLAQASDKLPSGWVVMEGVVQTTLFGSVIVSACAGTAMRNGEIAATAAAVRRRRLCRVAGFMEILAFGLIGVARWRRILFGNRAIARLSHIQREVYRTFCAFGMRYFTSWQKKQADAGSACRRNSPGGGPPGLPAAITG
jgi:hypothetical protein